MTLPSLLAANWKVWPAANVVSFKFIPQDLRALYGNVLGIAWVRCRCVHPLMLSGFHIRSLQLDPSIFHAESSTVACKWVRCPSIHALLASAAGHVRQPAQRRVDGLTAHAVNRRPAVIWDRKERRDPHHRIQSTEAASLREAPLVSRPTGAFPESARYKKRQHVWLSFV